MTALEETHTRETLSCPEAAPAKRKRVVIIGGGPGGIEHFFQQFAGPMAAFWKALGSPVLTPEVQKKLIDSVHTEAGSRTIEELEAERDEVLLGLIELRTRVQSNRADESNNKLVSRDRKAQAG